MEEDEAPVAEDDEITRSPSPSPSPWLQQLYAAGVRPEDLMGEEEEEE